MKLDRLGASEWPAVDTGAPGRETWVMLNPGASRQRLARALNIAYMDALLSESTLAHRLDPLFGSRLIDPASLIGDLSVRSRRRALSLVLARATRSSRWLWRRQSLERSAPPILLALDWLDRPSPRVRHRAHSRHRFSPACPSAIP